MVIPQAQLQEAWILQIANESKNVQVEWVRACSQWLCGLFPWDGRELTALALSTMDRLWETGTSMPNWDELSRLIAEQIPREDEVAHFELPDAVFEAAMATLSYTCRTMAGDFQTSVQLVTTWIIDAIYAPIEMGASSYEEQDRMSPDSVPLEAILENRLARSALISHAQAWRDQYT